MAMLILRISDESLSVFFVALGWSQEFNIHFALAYRHILFKRMIAHTISSTLFCLCLN